MKNFTTLSGRSLDIFSNTSRNLSHTGVPFFLTLAVTIQLILLSGRLTFSEELKLWLVWDFENHLVPTVDHCMVLAKLIYV